MPSWRVAAASRISPMSDAAWSTEYPRAPISAPFPCQAACGYMTRRILAAQASLCVLILYAVADHEGLSARACLLQDLLQRSARGTYQWYGKSPASH